MRPPKAGKLLCLLSLLCLPACTRQRESQPEPRRVIVLCDMSGSMLQRRPQMDTAVEHILATLQPGDLFNLGAAADENCAWLYSDPQSVLTDNRKAFDTFWNKTLTHGGDAMIEGAGWLVGQGPDLAWIITDGNIDDIDAVCRVLSSARRVKPFELKIVPIAPDPDDHKNIRKLEEAAGRPVTIQQTESSPAVDPATYFSIALPVGWSLAEIESAHALDDRYRKFAVRETKGSEVFVITVAVDGPSFIHCWCRPLSEYEKYEKDGIKYANLYLSDGKSRTLKAVGQRYGTDVHVNYESHDKGVLNKIAESIRPN